MKKKHPLDHFLQKRMQQGNISSTALLFTFFCDVVTQYGGEIWLGSVIHAFAPVGISERLTRTAVFRLVQDGWLESRKQGRRSYYRLTTTGKHYYQRAAKRIYASKQREWDGNWTLLFAAMVPKNKRDVLRKGLLWQGYGSLAPGVFAMPSSDRQALNQLLKDLHLQNEIVQMQARSDKSNHPDSLKNLVMARWDLDDLRRRFSDFNHQYSSAGKALQHGMKPSAHAMFLLRILLIHEYRRILLRDPELPSAMMPKNWEGLTARQLAANIYRQLQAPSDTFIRNELVNTKGTLHRRTVSTLKRFS